MTTCASNALLVCLSVCRFLGLSVGVVVPGQEREEKKRAYAADVIYATHQVRADVCHIIHPLSPITPPMCVLCWHQELGFDYLRDNLAYSDGAIVLDPAATGRSSPFYYCIVDEADSILIDDARNPLKISQTVGAPLVRGREGGREGRKQPDRQLH